MQYALYWSALRWASRVRSLHIESSLEFQAAASAAEVVVTKHRLLAAVAAHFHFGAVAAGLAWHAERAAEIGCSEASSASLVTSIELGHFACTWTDSARAR